MGAGRTYASAARYPGFAVSSGSRDVVSDEMDGLVSVRFKLAGVTELSSSTSFLCCIEAVVATFRSDGVDWLSGLRGMAESGRSLSSAEKMDKSSPFH